ncbi:MAG: hypothetical protein A3J54_00610 [Candidatus Ryanbacteria bacterium RIFCSPHIGHO2_02_FULL_45_13b]|uniref:Uncharacterized protein n=1 Tax=Candidatus Ryanbacteria bacterium RIFCSPHIGHO2_02_FULL_45_13b TaxID=1802117 RepID=A0A1G2G3I0_9BACT|nr:MAG: hypothetical protein A3J54_00610 [Candidatus Ryanbacteria bacterium RIFCSPHIGHO2_02_FULL_45_13b]
MKFLVQGELNHTPVKWGEADTREEAEVIARREIGEEFHLEDGQKVWGDPHRYGVFAQVTKVEE